MPRTLSLTGSEIRRTRPVRRIHGTYVSVALLPLPGASRAKAAVVVSKKVAVRATERNRIKRRIREALRATVARLPSGCGYLVSAKSAARAASYAELAADMAKVADSLVQSAA